MASAVAAAMKMGRHLKLPPIMLRCGGVCSPCGSAGADSRCSHRHPPDNSRMFCTYPYNEEEDERERGGGGDYEPFLVVGSVSSHPPNRNNRSSAAIMMGPTAVSYNSTVIPQRERPYLASSGGNITRRSASQYARRGGKSCPFRTLGVPQDVPYVTVKKSFLKLAMENHPDTAEFDGDEQREEAVERFMKVRKAFEQIIELDCGGAALRSSGADHMDDDVFDHWFYKETGHHAPDPFDLNLDAQTLKEVAESQSQAGLDRGGMWAMASALTQGLGNTSLGSQLRLEEGDSPAATADGTKARRRRRRR